MECGGRSASNKRGAVRQSALGMTRRRRERPRRSKCPVNHAVEILGDKWTLLVLRDMVFDQKRRFSDLKAMPEGIASNILADRLARLQEVDVVERAADENDTRQTRYTLTAHGRRLVPILLELMLWSHHHSADVDTVPEIIRTIEDDREGAIAEVLRRIDAKH